MVNDIRQSGQTEAPSTFATAVSTVVFARSLWYFTGTSSTPHSLIMPNFSMMTLILTTCCDTKYDPNAIIFPVFGRFITQNGAISPFFNCLIHFGYRPDISVYKNDRFGRKKNHLKNSSHWSGSNSKKIWNYFSLFFIIFFIAYTASQWVHTMAIRNLTMFRD